MNKRVGYLDYYVFLYLHYAFGNVQKLSRNNSHLGITNVNKVFPRIKSRAFFFPSL